MIRESIFEQLRRIPEDLHEINQRLENWAAWSRDRIRRGHCRSIEYRFQSGNTQQEDRGPRDQWDSLDAEKVHSVVVGLPDKSRWLIHLNYVHKAPEGYMRRVLGIHRNDIVSEMQCSMRMVRNAVKGS